MRIGRQQLILKILVGGAGVLFPKIDDVDNEDGDTELV